MRMPHNDWKLHLLESNCELRKHTIEKMNKLSHIPSYNRKCLSIQYISMENGKNVKNLYDFDSDKMNGQVELRSHQQTIMDFMYRFAQSSQFFFRPPINLPLVLFFLSINAFISIKHNCANCVVVIIWSWLVVLTP